MAIGNAATLINTDINPYRQQASIAHQLVSLSMAGVGEKAFVKYITGKDETRRFLSNLGFVEDAEVMVVSEINGNVIVNVKGTRMAISKSMAGRVLTVRYS